MSVRNTKLLEAVAERMGISDPNDPQVVTEAEKLLSQVTKRYIVLESHPNSYQTSVGKIGTEEEVRAYLVQMEQNGHLVYVGGIFAFQEGAEEEGVNWLEFDAGEPVHVRDQYHVSYGAFSKTGNECGSWDGPADSREHAVKLVREKLHERGFSRVNIYEVTELARHLRAMEFLHSIGAIK